MSHANFVSAVAIILALIAGGFFMLAAYAHLKGENPSKDLWAASLTALLACAVKFTNLLGGIL